MKTCCCLVKRWVRVLHFKSNIFTGSKTFTTIPRKNTATNRWIISNKVQLLSFTLPFTKSGKGPMGKMYMILRRILFTCRQWSFRKSVCTFHSGKVCGWSPASITCNRFWLPGTMFKYFSNGGKKHLHLSASWGIASSKNRLSPWLNPPRFPRKKRKCFPRPG